LTRGRKALLALIFAAALAGTGIWYLVQQSRVLQEARDLAGDVDVDVSMEGLTLSQGEEGKLRWKLEAAGAKYLQEQGRIRVDEPRITYYPKEDGRRLDVSAPEGEVDQDTEEAWLWPEVYMKSNDSVITAERLYYAGDNGTISLTGGVVLEREDMRVTSESAVIDLKSNAVVAGGGVRAVIHKTPEAAVPKE
jgi:LPS export ABC transporter protein LptC